MVVKEFTLNLQPLISGRLVFSKSNLFSLKNDNMKNTFSIKYPYATKPEELFHDKRNTLNPCDSVPSL